MTNIEQKALALAREVSPDDKNRVCKEPTVYFALWEALCRAIEKHEAFRQEVSDAVVEYADRDTHAPITYLGRFILPQPVDPLVEAIRDMALTDADQADADRLRAALAARGLEIREVQS